MPPGWGLSSSDFFLRLAPSAAFLRRFADGRARRPSSIKISFYRSLRTAWVKNLMESAIVAQSGPLYSMILGVPAHLPAWPQQRLKPRYILRGLRHD
jgi:hypothetical protein